ncbi:MAG: glucoamylase family protein [Candidatus Brachytrichaceae bacterium NZ_4S206]
MSRKLLFALVTSVYMVGCSVPIAPPPTAAPTRQPQAQPVVITPAPTPTISSVAPAATLEEVVAYEMEGAFAFFWEQANTDPSSAGYGLVRDRYPGSPGISSVAAVGFALTAYPIGVEMGYVTRREAQARVDGTLDTLLNMERVNGFFYHFVDMQTGRRAWNSEVSSIDTAILMMGVLTAGEYFGGETRAKAEQLYREVNWPWFVDESRRMFHMAYRPEKGFEGHWDFYAEQLMLYVLAAGSPTYPTDDRLYYGFKRHRAGYGDGEAFIHSWFGSLFTYQFSHAWIDFRDYTDRQGVNWFDNSVKATRAHYDFAVDVQDKYQTLGPLAWGLSACDGPKGYSGLYGAPPSGYDNKAHKVDDTVPPYAAIASILFLPEEAAQAMLNYFSIAPLKGRYGFKDAYNLSQNWYASDVIGIDKGIALLMLANYEDDLVYRITMKNEHILNGLERLGLQRNPSKP